MALLPRHMIAVQAGEPALKVLQWNTLADQLATDFPRASVEALQWTERQGLLIAELERSEADLIVLEEVDHYEDWFLPNLQRLGYEGRFQRKAGWHRDGTAVFYLPSKVRVETCETVTYQGQSQFFLLMQCVLLPATPFVLAATHLKAKAAFEDCRVAEIQHLLASLTPFQALPILVVGDFNSIPTGQVYSAVSASALRSVYCDALRPGEPEFTSLKYRDKLLCYTIDYIWQRGWKTLAVWSLPTQEEIGHQGLPCVAYPSDHLALLCHLSLA